MTEAKKDRRNKIIRFTQAGEEYTKKIILPVADAEIEAMGKLSKDDMKELVRLTTIFSRYMQKMFDEVGE